MPDRSPYTVKTLSTYLAELENQEHHARELPPAGELDEDPGLLLLARVAIGRKKLDDWPDVRRIKVHCVAAGCTFDAEGMSRFVARVCRDQALDLRDVGELSVDGFCNLVEKPSQTAAEKQSTNDARDAWMYEEKKAGKTHSQIRYALEKEHSEWEQLASDQAVGRAIDRYCNRKKLPLIRRKSE